MNPLLRNILAVLGGFAVGSIVNMSLINLGHAVIPPPPGADLSTMEGLKEAMPMFGPEQFLFPFLAHALGAFSGALVAAYVAVSRKMTFAIALGCLNLIGGILAVAMLPSPLWYSVVDILGAYLPFAYAAGKIATRTPAT